VLDALVGNPEYYKICGAVFACGTPLATDVGAGIADQGQRHGGSEKAASPSPAMTATLGRHHGAGVMS